ncbi:MAG: transporter ATP-binding protein [Ramlibacter sp.]|nr:transporter ATP-binding protein [Ramlibacter sp.]
MNIASSARGPEGGVAYLSKLRPTDASQPLPIIQVRNAGKQYSNGTLALTGVDLDLYGGDFVTLIGPSGCGKSTLLRILAGLGSVTQGQIEWWQESTPVLARPDQKLAFVFQDPTLMPWARVAENVALPLELRGALDARTIKAKVADVLALVGLAAFHEAYPRELSGGMQMRVSIARALVTEPNLMLMDEPFGALDEMTRNKLNDDLLRIWHERHLTVVFVTHSLQEAVYLSSRVVVMAARPGRVIDEVAIDAAFPRGPAFRLSADYLQHMGRLTNALDTASRKEEGAA